MDRLGHLSVDKFMWNCDDKYNDVHAWLDSEYPKFVGRNPYGHWLEKHHLEAVIKEYGSYTMKYNTAYMHILMDFLSHFSVAFVPQNREECERMLKSLDIL